MGETGSRRVGGGREEGRAASAGSPASPPAMTRCECAGISFGEIARRLREKTIALSELSASTGCGDMCTACLPDLEKYLQASKRRAG